MKNIFRETNRFRIKSYLIIVIVVVIVLGLFYKMELNYTIVHRP